MKKKVLTVFCLTDAIFTALLLLRAGWAALGFILACQNTSSVGIIGERSSALLLWICLRPWLCPAILLILLLIPALIWLKKTK